jgi:chromosome segregation ATPase
VTPDGLDGQRWMACERELFKANTTIEALDAALNEERREHAAERDTLRAERDAWVAASEQTSGRLSALRARVEELEAANYRVNKAWAAETDRLDALRTAAQAVVDVSRFDSSPAIFIAIDALRAALGGGSDEG